MVVVKAALKVAMSAEKIVALRDDPTVGSSAAIKAGRKADLMG